MVAEWKAEKVERRAGFKEALDAKVDGVKARVDARAKAAIDKLDDWIKEVTGSTDEEDTAAVSQVGLAMQGSEELNAQEASGSGYGYGALAIGAAATVFYLYKKRQEEKRAHLFGECTLDEGFLSV